MSLLYRSTQYSPYLQIQLPSGSSTKAYENISGRRGYVSSICELSPRKEQNEWYLKSPMPDAYGQGPHGTTLNRNNAYPDFVQSSVTGSDTLPYKRDSNGTRSPSKSSFPASAAESFESINRLCKHWQSRSRYSMVSAAILVFSAIRIPILIVDPACCYSGLWLAVCMMILSRKPTPRRVGLSASSHSLSGLMGVDDWMGLSLRYQWIRIHNLVAYTRSPVSQRGGEGVKETYDGPLIAVCEGK
jgi:hypothetical protein